MMLLQAFASNNNIATKFYRVYIWQVLALLCAAAKRCLMNSFEYIIYQETLFMTQFIASKAIIL